ncbi:HD domain-containing phosphohydrolase [Desulfoluna spongiiphila]|uniref:HD domain-containing protein n=1 Tax=Desulfoluna spongiiphila TaxID=419481 RepID=A0A1G5GTW8_9BACT|nr:HD domain-containing phosphohydrolase [Desulfoluna spongiiphila]SCY54088.1 HD domain-containing protein [Desulfoluna spongiiphila]VVS92859.1 hd-gyp domain [Desulfoluna spongiiphila]
MRYNTVTEGLEHDLRATVHYLLVLVVMGGYGAGICPMVHSMPVVAWLFIVGTVLVFARGARAGLSRFVFQRTPPRWQVAGLFFLDVVLLGGAGVVISMQGDSWYGGGMRSAIELSTGFMSLGFFIGTDLALIHNRRLALTLGRGLFTMTGHFVSVSRKLVLVTVSSLVAVTVTLGIVIFNDFYWLTGQSMEALASYKKAVFFNQVFVITMLMGYTANIVMTYARNIHLFLDEETRTLSAVAAGNFNTRVPVAFNNELGVIASYTNRMIDGLQAQNLMVEKLRDVIINSMASLAETRDNETGSHIRRTQHYVKLLAETLAEVPGYRDVLTPSAIDLLYKTAPLHDIGKVGVPDAILLKPGPLTEEEFSVMKLHTLRGEEAIRRAEFKMGPGADTSFLSCAREIAGGHHEKWDGSGYPRGLSGCGIPLSARLMALADVYDALRSRRVYKDACDHGEARRIILEGRGTHFDPDVVDAFVACEDRFVGVSSRFEDTGESRQETLPMVG